MDKSSEELDLEKDYLEEMEAIEALEAIGTLESAPPYPGQPGDYGGINLGHNLAYISSPYPNVNMGYTSFPEPGGNTHFQGGSNPGTYSQTTSPTQGIYPQINSPNPGMYPQVNSPNPYPQATSPNPGTYPQTTTVTTTVRMPSLSDLPAQTMCPHCKLQVITITEHFSGLSAWVACGCLALIGCWPCCLMPFWMDSCKDVEHRCPNCNNILCYYKRL
ncbi:uncharacterized protein [Danio rerio]|uniref:Uncharacterized protein n=1 Tax=Danio rerio TaxID=7955 RepID=A0AC58J4J8_DANRE